MRIDWGPDGRRLLVCHADRSLRIHGLDGSIRELAPAGGILDTRWLADGRIVAVDAYGDPVHFTMQGARYAEPRTDRTWRYPAAAIAGTGSVFVLLGTNDAVLYQTNADRTEIWRFVPYDYSMARGRDPYGVTRPVLGSVAISEDGCRVALGYTTAPYAGPAGSPQLGGRGYVVLDVTGPAARPRWTTWRAPVLGHHWYPVELAAGPVTTALVGVRGAWRILLVPPESEPIVLRVGEPADLAVDVVPAACAGVIDEQGMRAMYAFGSRVRIDYLAPTRKGPALVEVVDSAWLDPEVGMLDALGYDAAGQRIACLGTSGRIEIIPVP